MTTLAIESAAQSAAPQWSARARWLGWVLLAGWVLVIVAAGFLGERDSTLATLRSAVASGDVDVVRVAGGLPDGSGVTGYAGLELHWREGLRAYRAEVREARPLKAEHFNGNLEVVRAGVVDRLVASQPGLRVVHQPSSFHSSFEGSVMGWHLPQWLAWASLLLALATLGLLIAGPEPLRATRWAWFWIFGIATPVGVLAYLVLAGPAAQLRPPRPGARRLTGGWAFLLALVVSSVLQAAATEIQ